MNLNNLLTLNDTATSIVITQHFAATTDDDLQREDSVYKLIEVCGRFYDISKYIETVQCVCGKIGYIYSVLLIAQRGTNILIRIRVDSR